jgi:hypothetical protein
LWEVRVESGMDIVIRGLVLVTKVRERRVVLLR